VPVPAVRSGPDKLRWVHAYDDRTLVFFHKEPMATWRENMQFPILPKHIYETLVQEDPTLQDSEGHQKYENSPVTCGPYAYKSRKRGQEIVLARHEGYFMHKGQQVRRKPFAKEIRIKIIPDPNTSLLALRSGEIEETQLTSEQWVTDATNNDEFYGRNTKVTGVEWVEFHFVWNCGSPFFSDKRVRLAMSYAFDHQEMLDNIFYGLYEPCNGPFHHTARFYPQDPPPFFTQDLDKAEDLLDEAGWDDSDFDGIRDKDVDGKLKPFEFTLNCPQTPNAQKVSVLLKDNLEQIGIICNVKPTEFTVLMQIDRDHKFHATMGGWGTGTDPSTLRNIFGTGQGRNYGLYSNPKVDELFDRGDREFDPQARDKIYEEIHRILAADQPYTWLFYRNSFYGFNRRLRGYNFSPRGPYGVSPGFFSIWVPAQQP
jgi:peptide/nickel transport system substrate-binding protein